MKLFRQIAFSAIVTLSAFAAVTYTSCSKDKCSGITCSNVGTCSNGVCTCNTGYEGTNCETKSNAKFVGTFNAAESCGGTNSTPYQVTITADATDPTKLTVGNLGNYNCSGGTITFDATVNLTTLTIAESKCSTQMNATGTYNTNGSITITYTAIYGSNTDNCTVTLTK